MTFFFLRQLIDLATKDEFVYIMGYQSRKGICQLNFIPYTDLQPSSLSF